MHVVGLLGALLLNPWLAARAMFPRAAGLTTFAAWGVAAHLLNTAVPLALHLAAVPITPRSLLVAHALLGLALAAVVAARRVALLPVLDDTARALLPVALGLSVILLPLTPMAGIDTYKWQDLAQTIVIDRRITWLIHPLSFFGYTPRSYPSIYPIVSGGLQTIGGLGTDGGFYVMSVLTALTGLGAAALLAGRFTPAPRARAVLALLYVASPIFMRYTHWATGRGTFLAFLPLTLAAWLDPRRPAAPAAGLALLLLLPAMHKTGVVACLLIPGALIGAHLLRPGWKPVVPALALAAWAVSIALAPPLLLPGWIGKTIGWWRLDLARFVWMTPVILAVTLVAPGRWMAAWPSRVMLLLYLGALPLSHPHQEMYGAMLCLPQAVFLSADGALWLAGRLRLPRRRVVGLACALTLLGGAAIVVQRTLQATPPRIRRAARFLDAYDPTGPFVVVSTAPGRIRTAFQAYTLGCPRFEVQAGESAAVSVAATPQRRPTIPETAKAWIGWLRRLLSAGDIATQWYGAPRRRYTVIVDGHTAAPPGARRIYDREGVAIYETRLDR